MDKGPTRLKCGLQLGGKRGKKEKRAHFRGVNGEKSNAENENQTKSNPSLDPGDRNARPAEKQKEKKNWVTKK